ncbi:MAG: Nif3-like dinuclear metal center hexameric protein [Propionibacteriaceae bacterium]|jgi:putative NIF3 family GTP cyclohydrolase 1 type 2|nr:Nif3-like dinuclear metal center hexameric protein [Propionibacteriaceae bacterium]
MTLPGDRAESGPGPRPADGVPSAPPPSTSTARELVWRIRQALPVELGADSVDVFLEGDPDLAVSGVAVTMMATFEVLEAAVANGANLVITHEPVYFNHHNAFAAPLAEALDPVFLVKRQFLRDHQLVVWHCHDLLHQLEPDMIHLGILTALGWPIAGIGGPSIVELPPTPLEEVLSHLADKLGATSLRYVGDQRQLISRIAVGCGYASLQGYRSALLRDDLDLVLVGEAWEWEFGEYVYDTAFLSAQAQRPRAFAVIGHIPSEQQGMAYFSEQLREIIPEIPVYFTPAADLYRSL